MTKQPKNPEPPSQGIPGVTPSERYLNQLARRSFLSMWSYPNLYTDEGRKNGKGDGKELCDLVVIFDNNILLFSDKHCEFPEHENIKVAWARWYKRAIEKSVRQLNGAESWIRRYPNRIFTDSTCTQQFSLPIPDPEKANYYRFAVTRGAYGKCKEFFQGDSTGTLIINTEIRGNEHRDTPFQVGHVNPDHEYVHVLDELTLDILLREFDTVSDFAAYVKKKETLLLNPARATLAAGEEQLIALYLTQFDEKGEHVFPELPDAADRVMFGEGYWEDLIGHPQYIAKKEADRKSYAWDNLINHFVENARNHDKSHVEYALRAMASEPRIRRRQLASVLMEALKQKLAPNQWFTRLISSNTFPDTAYVFFVICHPEPNADYEEFRQFRRSQLLARCKAAVLLAPNSKRIIGIAAEPAGSSAGSEDIILIQAGAQGWTPEQMAEAEELKDEYDLFREGRTTRKVTHDDEYPILDTMAPLRNKTSLGRNRAQRRAMERKQRRKAKRSEE